MLKDEKGLIFFYCRPISSGKSDWGVQKVQDGKGCLPTFTGCFHSRLSWIRFRGKTNKFYFLLFEIVCVKLFFILNSNVLKCSSMTVVNKCKKNLINQGLYYQGEIRLKRYINRTGRYASVVNAAKHAFSLCSNLPICINK